MTVQDSRYQQVTTAFGPALSRLARAYEADPEKRRDLLQDIHLAIWRSLENFEERCSLRTWVYRVAHNAAVTHVVRQRRLFPELMGLEQVESMSGENPVDAVDQQIALEQLMMWIHRLRPPDRQVMLLYLEDLDAAAIGEITGLSAGNVRIQIHRIKNILARRFHGGDRES